MKNDIKTIFSNKYKKIVISVVNFLLGSLILSFFFRQNPLYRSNQHTKFLHGLAQAGYGFLDKDWLANTLDPLPVFSFLVYFTYRFFHEYLFYFYYIIILGIFIYSILGISSILFNINSSILKKVFYFTIIISIHSILFDSITYNIFGFRLMELILERGVAGQYMLRSRFPKWGMILDIFIIIFVFIISLYISASYQTLLDSLASADITFLEDYTTKTSMFVLNLPIFVSIIGVIMMILFHSSIPKKSEERIDQPHANSGRSHSQTR